MKKEFYRQAIHYFAGNAIIALLMLFGTKFAFSVSFILLIAGFALSTQLVKKAKHPAKEIILLVERDGESRLPGKGAFMLFAGMTITLFLFPDKTIALAALIALTYGDVVSTIVGKLFGKTKIIGERTIEGSLAGMMANFFMLALFLLPGQAILTAIAAMLAEYLPTDDNVSIPLVAATALTFLI